MKSIDTYIIEKFKIGSDIHTYKDLSKDEFNDKSSAICLEWAEEFLSKTFDKDDYEIKVNSRGEVLVYLYSYNGLDRESKKEKEKITTDFFNFYKDKNQKFAEEYLASALSWVDITKYGFKIIPNFAFDREDFNKTVFKGRK